MFRNKEKRDLQSSQKSQLKMQVKWSPQHVVESHWLRNHSPSQPVKKSFSYLYCSQEFSGKPWLSTRKMKGKLTLQLLSSSVLASLWHSQTRGNLRSPAGLWSERESLQSQQCPHRVVCEPPRSWVSTRETDQPNRDGFHSWCQEFILLFNAGTNALFNKAIISMFGILWLSGTFRMPLS